MQNLSNAVPHPLSPAPATEPQQWLAEALQPMDLFDRWGDMDPIRSAGRREMLPGLMALREIANRNNVDEHFSPNAHDAPNGEISELIFVLLLLRLSMIDEQRREGEERTGRERALNVPRPFVRRPLENHHRHVFQQPRLHSIPSHSIEEES